MGEICQKQAKASAEPHCIWTLLVQQPTRTHLNRLTPFRSYHLIDRHIFNPFANTLTVRLYIRVPRRTFCHSFIWLHSCCWPMVSAFRAPHVQRDKVTNRIYTRRPHISRIDMRRALPQHQRCLLSTNPIRSVYKWSDQKNVVANKRLQPLFAIKPAAALCPCRFRVSSSYICAFGCYIPRCIVCRECVWVCLERWIRAYMVEGLREADDFFRGRQIMCARLVCVASGCVELRQKQAQEPRCVQRSLKWAVGRRTFYFK